ncbi:DUF5677 domain-containing protein [Bacillus sp. UMB0728]|uniref:DUF5677 domain-containing protein n=1 Tax=Bacillus sp. UMB0728 TaxID=2066052 RepID=UPI000C783CBB|nr:DUF5677 domain-containing protein [Bacillus sp. UMB0728]PLR72267.1 hypothetical protein CYJ37_11975 [Bacillus sp. UMB0728]
MKLLKLLHAEAELVTQNVLQKHFDINKPEKQFDVHDAAIIGLFEDMIGKTNSLILLLDNKSFNGADSLTRMMMENFIYLKFILQKDTIGRGKSYFYSLKLRQVKFFNQMVEQSLMGGELRKYLNFTIDMLNTKFPKMADKDFTDELKQNYLNSLNHKDLKQKWYSISKEINNFRALCKYLKYEKEYILLYQSLSSEVHALEAANYFKFDENYVEVYRKEGEIETHVAVVSRFLNDIIKEVYSYYGLKEDLKNFNTRLTINYKFIR